MLCSFQETAVFHFPFCRVCNWASAWGESPVIVRHLCITKEPSVAFVSAFFEWHSLMHLSPQFYAAFGKPSDPSEFHCHVNNHCELHQTPHSITHWSCDNVTTQLQRGDAEKHPCFEIKKLLIIWDPSSCISQNWQPPILVLDTEWLCYLVSFTRSVKRDIPNEKKLKRSCPLQMHCIPFKWQSIKLSMSVERGKQETNLGLVSPVAREWFAPHVTLQTGKWRNCLSNLNCTWKFCFLELGVLGTLFLQDADISVLALHGACNLNMVPPPQKKKKRCKDCIRLQTPPSVMTSRHIHPGKCTMLS